MKFNLLHLFALALASVLAISSSGRADTLYWDGNVSTINDQSDNTNTAAQDWLSGGNWDDGTTSAPLAGWTSGDSAVFGGSAASQTITAVNLTIGDLTFGSGPAGAGTTGTAYTISGGTLTLGAPSVVRANTDTTISSVLAGSGGSLTKEGDGTLTLTAVNTFTGTTTINAGTLAAAGAGSYGSTYLLGLTVVVNDGATLRTDGNHRFGTNPLADITINSGGTFDLNSQTGQALHSLTLNGNALVTNSSKPYLMLSGGVLNYTGTGSQQATLASKLRLSGWSADVDATFTVNGTNAAGDLILSGVISSGGDLTKAGTGTLILSGVNTYTGATFINAGTMLVNGNQTAANGAVTVGANGTLGGTGTLGGATTVSGILAPGTSVGVGMIKFTNNLTLDSDSTYRFELTGGGTTADLTDLTGNLTFGGGTLDLVQLGTFTVGDKFTLFAYDGTLAGSFGSGSIVNGAGGLWNINYADSTAGLNGGTGNAFVTITAAVPEPGTVAMLLGGLGLLTIFRRRR